MGQYINPPDMTKEKFLSQHGREVSDLEAFNYPFTGTALPVCLVDNGHFLAAAIAYNRHELLRFFRGMNGRPHQWYIVPHKDLEPYLKGDSR